MKKTLMFMLTIAMALIFSVSTASAWFISVEPLDTVVDPGDPFYAGVYFNADAGGNFLQAYTFEIAFDTEELTWNSSTANSQHTPPSPLMAMFGDPAEYESGLIWNWSAAIFGTGGATVTDKTQLAMVEFSPVYPNLLLDGLPDVWFTGEDGNSLFKVDETIYDWGEYEVVAGPDVAPVPIPGAALLLGSGLLGLVGIGRRKIMG